MFFDMDLILLPNLGPWSWHHTVEKSPTGFDVPTHACEIDVCSPSDLFCIRLIKSVCHITLHVVFRLSPSSPTTWVLL